VRKIVIVPLLALALALPAAAPALAAGSGARSEHSSTDDRANDPAGHRSGRSDDKGKDAGRKDVGRKDDKGDKDRAKPRRLRFIELGTVASVDESAGTLTLTVRRGKFKALGTGVVNISVTADTAIRRDGADAALADLVSGDRVVVEGVRTGSTLVAGRVWVRGAKPVDGELPELPLPSVTPTPVTPTPTPSATAVS
jgi:hypothetical protein